MNNKTVEIALIAATGAFAALGITALLMALIVLDMLL